MRLLQTSTALADNAFFWSYIKQQVVRITRQSFALEGLPSFAGPRWRDNGWTSVLVGSTEGSAGLVRGPTVPCNHVDEPNNISSDRPGHEPAQAPSQCN